jgi:hypothetical protein|nr:hypothetical protein [Paenibacillus xylanexedens]
MLEHIITTSRDILMGQIDYYKIEINNEADLQLNFSYILKSVGDLFKFGIDHHLKINLETPFRSNNILSKSGSNKSKIDVTLEWYGSTNQVITCAIELKYFLTNKIRESHNRYSVFCDLKNLEEYVQHSREFKMGYFLLGTNDTYYVNQKSYSKNAKDFDFRHNSQYKADTKLTYITRKREEKTINLINDYHFSWQKVNGYYFLDQFIYRNKR